MSDIDKYEFFVVMTGKARIEPDDTLVKLDD